MPAAQMYPSPHVQLMRLAREARAEGIPFKEFWDRATDPTWLKTQGRWRPPVTWEHDAIAPPTAVRWPRDTQDRRLSRNAILQTREGWQRAYDQIPPEPRETALSVLAPALDALGRLSLVAAA